MLSRHSNGGGKPAPSITSQTLVEATDTIDVTFTGSHLPAKVYWQVRAQASAAPTIAELRNNTGGEVGGNYTATAIPDSEAVSLSGASNGDKTMYLVIQDKRGFYSAISSDDFSLAGA